MKTYDNIQQSLPTKPPSRAPKKKRDEHKKEKEKVQRLNANVDTLSRLVNPTLVLFDCKISRRGRKLSAMVLDLGAMGDWKTISSGPLPMDLFLCDGDRIEFDACTSPLGVGLFWHGRTIQVQSESAFGTNDYLQAAVHGDVKEEDD